MGDEGLILLPKIRHILLFYITALIEMLQSVNVNMNSVGLIVK